MSLSGKENTALADAVIYVINNRTGNGVITHADDKGSYTTLPMVAEDGDTLDVSYEIEDEPSDPKKTGAAGL